MSKRKSVTGEVLHDVRNAYDSILKTTELRSKAVAQQLTWANAEDNPYFMMIFGKLAELQYMYAEAEKKMAQSFLEVNKAFRNILQEEHLLEEMKREQHNYQNKVAKLQKQLESVRKKGDPNKLQVLETETSAQAKLYSQLSLSVEAKAKKLELYKIKLLKKGLRKQAEGVLVLSNQSQQLYAAQMELLDILPDDLPTGGDGDMEAEKNELNQRMSAVVSNLSTLLGIIPPPNGGVNHRRRPTGDSSSSPRPNRQSLIETIFLKKDSPKMERSKHYHSSLDTLDQTAFDQQQVTPNNDIIPPSPTSSSDTPPYGTDTPPCSDSPIPQHKGVLCEIVIPAVHTKGRPVLAKSKSETSVLRTEDESVIMSSRFDKRLEEAGLLKHLDEESDNIHFSSQPTSSASSSTEELMRNTEDPGYARLAILPTGPVLPSSGPVVPKRGVPPKVMEEGEEVGYANPADAIKISPHMQHISQQHFSNSPSPPSSPVMPPERPLKSPVNQKTSGYESVDEIRKMREKQRKEKEERRDTMGSTSRSQASTESTHSSKGAGAQFDDNPGYSQPFNALNRGHKVRVLPGEKPPTSLSWQRTGSNGKKKESSAKSLHLVGAGGVSSPVGPGGVFLEDTGPEDYVTPVRSSSTSARATHILKALGGRRSQPDLLSPAGSKPGNQTTVVVPTKQPKVNRFILEVEENQNGEDAPQPPLRGTTGRSQSMSSQMPAKITKLRTGHVTVVSGKTVGTNKNDKQ